MKRLIVAALGLAALTSTAVPAFGDAGGTVGAQVTVASPCIEVAPSTIDFGTLSLSTAALPIMAQLPVTARNCGAAREQLLARGSNAAGSGGAAWTLVNFNLCDAPNRFGQYVARQAVQYDLTGTDQVIGPSFAPSLQEDLFPGLMMPCTGSDGAGEVMSFSYVFTAVLA